MRSARWGALVLSLSCAVACSSGLAQVAGGRRGLDRLVPMEVVVNGSKQGTWVVVERDGMLYVPKDAFDEWRIQTKAGAVAVDVGGVPHLPLESVPGFTSKVDFSTQTLELTFSPQAFAATRLGALPIVHAEPSPSLPSAFINYDLSLTDSHFRAGPAMRSLGALTEFGLSTPVGVLTSSFSGRAGNSAFGLPDGWTRLETTFTRDFPAERLTLRVGDSITQPGLLGRAVYFGGIRLGTNFNLTPGFLSQPLPTVSGLSSAPSTVELYINDVLRQVSSVPTGPFTIANVPQFSGAGEVRLVVRDLLGRETVLVQPFFTSPRLLAPGLIDWSVETGAVRRDFGLESSNYGERFASATLRRGHSDRFTHEFRAELGSSLQTLSVGTVAALPASMLGQAAVMWSRHEQGEGHQWLLGADRIGTRGSLGFQLQGGSSGFRQLGQDPGSASIRLQALGNASFSLDRAGTFGFGFASLSRHDGSRTATVSGNYSLRVLDRGTLSLTWGKVVAGGTGTNVALTLTLPLDNRYVVSSSVSSHQSRREFYAAASHTPRDPNAIAWRLLAGGGTEGERAEAGLFHDGQKATLTADVTASRTTQAIRIGAAGGLALAGGKVFASKRILESYALVEVPGYANVGVSLGSTPLTRTDADGVAFIPRLLPYQRNSIRLDPQDLPLSAELDSIEMEAVPRWRSGARVRFPVRFGRGALLRIVMEDGTPAPAGAVVRIAGDQEGFYVARRGEAFVTGLGDRNTLTLVFEGGSCTFDLRLPPASPEEIPRLGPLECRKLKQ